ncbi:translation initiation factor IF-2-like [Ornithorhynchus anatinus]|uniref:translation initiation factor IF-2-like n=1 Tax=Ornithorhynchus anatinus TaxID=9258 RepID=UPI0010A794A6|nr:translation initiation factor IF-2-like [Ornithorhynchus anatinus]
METIPRAWACPKQEAEPGLQVWRLCGRSPARGPPGPDPPGPSPVSPSPPEPRDPRELAKNLPRALCKRSRAQRKSEARSSTALQRDRPRPPLAERRPCGHVNRLSPSSSSSSSSPPLPTPGERRSRLTASEKAAEAAALATDRRKLSPTGACPGFFPRLKWGGTPRHPGRFPGDIPSPRNRSGAGAERGGSRRVSPVEGGEGSRVWGPPPPPGGLRGRSGVGGLKTRRPAQPCPLGAGKAMEGEPGALPGLGKSRI